MRSSNSEDAFIVHGYRNWKNAMIGFARHENCSSHRICAQLFSNLHHGVNGSLSKTRRICVTGVFLNSSIKI